MALLRLLPATLKLGARGRLLQRHSLCLNMGRCISVQGCRAVFGSASCWKKWFRLRGASVVIIAALGMQNFQLGSKVYTQVQGSPMGSPLSPALCLMVVSVYEQIWYHTHRESISNLHLHALFLRSDASQLRLLYRTALAGTFMARFFFAGSCLGMSQAERPSVSWHIHGKSHHQINDNSLKAMLSCLAVSLMSHSICHDATPCIRLPKSRLIERGSLSRNMLSKTPFFWCKLLRCREDPGRFARQSA